LREALELGHHYTGTEHLLLGLLKEGEDTGAKVVVAAGVQPDELREAVLALV
jgi:ATP-dependent Clp protease ATP-binding subunit ClpC